MKKFFILLIILFFNYIYGETSNTRVGSIGFSGLIPDKETDLYYNPAYINFIQGNRIFASFDSNYSDFNQENSYQGIDIDEQSSFTYSISPGLCFIKGNKDIKIGIKYTPSFYKNNYESKYDPDTSISNNIRESSHFRKSNNVGNIEGLLGLRLTNRISSSLSVGLNTYKYESTYEKIYEDPSFFDTFDIDQNDYLKYLLNFGLVFHTNSGNKYGFKIGCNLGTGNEYNEDIWYYKEKLYLHDIEIIDKSYAEINTIIMPEIKLGKKNLLRSYIELNYQNKDNKYTYKKHPNHLRTDYEYNRINSKFGIGLLTKQNNNTLWIFGIRYNGDILDKESYRDDTDNNTPDTYHSFTYEDIIRTINGRIGIEKQLYPNILIIRSYLSYLDLQYHNVKKKTVDQDKKIIDYVDYKTLNLDLPVAGYGIGIGINLFDNLLVDILFSRPIGYEYKTYNREQITQSTTGIKRNYNTNDYFIDIDISYAF